MSPDPLKRVYTLEVEREEEREGAREGGNERESAGGRLVEREAVNKAFKKMRRDELHSTKNCASKNT
jgi:hypothetical protein